MTALHPPLEGTAPIPVLTPARARQARKAALAWLAHRADLMDDYADRSSRLRAATGLACAAAMLLGLTGALLTGGIL